MQKVAAGEPEKAAKITKVNIGNSASESTKTDVGASGKLAISIGKG